MSKTAVGLMAKIPILGKVKTRLASSIGDERALQVYRQLLADSYNLLRELDTNNFHRAAFVTPEDGLSDFKVQHTHLDSYSPQDGSDLGERMTFALTQLLSQDTVSEAILIGADCPQLTTELIIRASLLLKDHDVVVGPTEDGGYYLIGVKSVHDKLFYGIEWSTETVLDETRSIAEGLGLTLTELPVLKDLDNEEDMRYFIRNGILEFHEDVI